MSFQRYELSHPDYSSDQTFYLDHDNDREIISLSGGDADGSLVVVDNGKVTFALNHFCCSAMY